LIERARSGDAAARDQLVREFAPMAGRIGRRFATSMHPHQELTQVAEMAVLKALDRHDTSRDAAFAAYAQARMAGEVRRHIRDSRMVHVPRSLHEQVPALRRALTRLRSELGREPTLYRLAAELQVTKEEVIEIIDAASHGEELEHVLSELTPPERMVVDLRFEEGLSQTAIATALALAETQVSRVIRQGLDKLAHGAGAVPA
jgi:RNA polymerase sigma-B factor